MSFCGKCGTEVATGNSFCTACGSAVENSNKPNHANPAPLTKNVRGRSGLSALLIGVIVVLAGIGISVTLFLPSAEPEDVACQNFYLIEVDEIDPGARSRALEEELLEIAASVPGTPIGEAIEHAGIAAGNIAWAFENRFTDETLSAVSDFNEVVFLPLTEIYADRADKVRSLCEARP